MTQLFFMEIEPFCDKSILNELMKHISGVKKERVLRYRSTLDRKLGVYADVLVRCMICMISGVSYKDIEFKVSDTGKPYLTRLLGYDFSITHTKNAIAAAVSDQSVGVDVERIREVDISIAERIFSDNEMEWLNAAPNKHIRFLEIWTKKEALIKKRGTGLTNNLRIFDVTSASPRERYVSYELGDYIVSICSSYESREIEFVKTSEPELVEMWRHLIV